MGCGRRRADRDGGIRGAITSTSPRPKASPRPRFVLPNGGGLGYGLFVLDDASRATWSDHVEQLPDPLTRGSAWVTLWDNLLEGGWRRPRCSTRRCARCRPRPTSRTAQRILGYWRAHSGILARPRSAGARAGSRRAPDGLARAATQSQKSAWFNAFRDVVMTARRAGLARARVAARGEDAGAHACRARRDRAGDGAGGARGAGWQEILDAPARADAEPRSQGALRVRDAGAVGDPAERERSFERFTLSRTAGARRGCRKPAVSQPSAARGAGQRFVQPALEMLREIQQTGDIFFPTRWMDGRCGATGRPRWPRPCAPF